MPFAVPPPPRPLVWLAQPSREDIVRADGAHAFRHDRGGKASMSCYVRSDGRLEACEEADGDTTPGFAEALGSLADRYRLDVPASGGPLRVTVSVAFPKLNDIDAKSLSKETDAERVALAPPGVEGEVALDCKVTVEGLVADCQTEPDEDGPANPALVSAALKLSAKRRYAPAVLARRPIESWVSMRFGFFAHVIDEPDWVHKPSGDDLARYYPVDAAASAIGASVRMKCLVSAVGALQSCVVISERPAGLGFGDALLRMAPKFTMKPKSVDGVSVAGGVVVIPVKFIAPNVPKPNPRDPDTFSVTPWMPWTQAPTPAAVAAAFPKRALQDRVFGRASFRCDMTRAGALTDCEDTEETPGNRGFSRAARSLAPLFRTDMSKAPAPASTRLKVAISVDFSERALQPPATRFVRRPEWLIQPSAEKIIAAYPEEAIKAGVLTGRGLVDCSIGDNGDLGGCVVAGEEPSDLGFGPAAVRVATAMRANLWTRDGEAAAGQKVRLPLRFIYSGDPVEAGKPGAVLAKPVTDKPLPAKPASAASGG